LGSTVFGFDVVRVRDQGDRPICRRDRFWRVPPVRASEGLIGGVELGRDAVRRPVRRLRAGAQIRPAGLTNDGRRVPVGPKEPHCGAGGEGEEINGIRTCTSEAAPFTGPVWAGNRRRTSTPRFHGQKQKKQRLRFFQNWLAPCLPHWLGMRGLAAKTCLRCDFGLRGFSRRRGFEGGLPARRSAAMRVRVDGRCFCSRLTSRAG